nr:hypothetical protein [Tanacetum cinerariifolium]
MIKESVDAIIAAERARHANAGNNDSGSGQARGQVTAPVVRECTFARFMKCNPDNFRGTGVFVGYWLIYFGVNFTIDFYELLSDLDTKRKARDPLGYYNRSWDAYGDKDA